MKLEAIASGDSVFVDANIFIYHFTNASEQATAFLTRCEQEELAAVTSVHVLLEVLHRLMMIEALKKGLVKPPKILQKLKRKPSAIRNLSEYYRNTAEIPEMGIRIVPLAPELLETSHQMRTRFGMLVSDSLILAVMHEQGVRSLATHDRDFARVNWVALYQPDDVQV